MRRRKIAILGASTDRRKYGNKAVRAYQRQGYDVYPVHPHAKQVEGLPAYASLADVPVETLDRISVYLPPEIGITLLDEIKRKGAKEVWFNPGSESPELFRQAEAIGLEIINACSITNVGLNPSQFPNE